MRGDRGSAAIVLIVIVLIALLLGGALIGVGQVLVARARAVAAADAAALAAAPVTFHPFGAEGTPWQEAERFAAINGARLLSCSCPVDPSFEPRTVQVRVETRARVIIVGSVRVRAAGRAEFRPAALLDR